MDKTSLREFVRNYQSLFPLKRDGLEIERRNTDSLFIYPQQMYASTNDVDNLADLIAEKVVDNLKNLKKVATTPEVKAVEQPKTVVYEEPLHRCEIKSIFQWEKVCDSHDTSHLMVASLREGTPMSSDDWKDIWLCPIHSALIKKMNDFEVEDA